MKWEVILVPLIAMIVAILASVFRGAEEAKRRNNRRSGSDPDARRGRPRSDSSGIDQFLEEIRRRQAARQESGRTAQRETPSPREEVPSPPVEEQPPPPPRRREAPVITLAVEAPSAPVIVPVEIPPARPVASAAPVVVFPVTAATAPSAVRDQLTALLRTKPGLRTALLLREIIGEPKCRRR